MARTDLGKRSSNGLKGFVFLVVLFLWINHYWELHPDRIPDEYQYTTEQQDFIKEHYKNMTIGELTKNMHDILFDVK